MGAAAAVGFQLPDENLPQNLELQAAANWHRIIKHANNGGSSASAPGSSDREVAFVSRGPQRLFEVYTSGSHTPHALPMEESVAPNVFRTVMHPSEDEKNGMLADLKANSKVFQISERVPTSMRLSRRSGNTLVLEWDCGDDAQALADASVQLGAVLPAGVRYEVIAGKGQSSAVQWHLIFCDQLEARSLAVRCSECDTLYHFRCRRLIPSQADSAAKTESWTPGSWGPQISVRSGPGAPSPPARPSLLEIGCSSLSVTWMPPQRDNGLPVLHYTVRLVDPLTAQPLFESRLETAGLRLPLLLEAPDAPLWPDSPYCLFITAGNRAGESSAGASIAFSTRRLDELSLTPWAFAIDHCSHAGYYKHLASGSVSNSLPFGALVDEEASFDNKLKHFRQCISQRRQQLRLVAESDTDQLVAALVINRDNLLQDSLTLLSYCDPLDLEMNPIRIQFEGEKGIDNGGLAKDWFTSVARELLDPKFGLFCSCDGSVIDTRFENDADCKTDKSCSDVHFSSDLRHLVTPLSNKPIICLNVASINTYAAEDGDIDTFRSVGIFIGKALVDERTIGYNIDPILIKWLLHATEEKSKSVDGEEEKETGGVRRPGMLELAQSDFRMYTGLRWIMDATDTELEASELTFSTTHAVVASDVAVNTVELIPGGARVLVDGTNKGRFVELLLSWLVKDRYEPALSSLLNGFTSVVPPFALRFISVAELSVMLSGRAFLNLTQLRQDTVYSGIKFSRDHELAMWFWEVVQSMDQRTIAGFLLLCTGSYYMPVQGYSPKFNVTMHDYSQDGKSVNDDRLPEAHTCFNQIIFPEYSSKSVLQTKLVYAIENNGSIFSLL